MTNLKLGLLAFAAACSLAAAGCARDEDESAREASSQADVARQEADQAAQAGTHLPFLAASCRRLHVAELRRMMRPAASVFFRWISWDYVVHKFFMGGSCRAATTLACAAGIGGVAGFERTTASVA